MIEKIRVNLAKKTDDSYDIIIGKNLFSDIAEGLKKIPLGRIAVITDSNVKKLHGNKFLSALKEKELDCFMVSFPAGEQSKNRGTKERIEDVLISQDLGRDGIIIALGGGVVGDLAGFIASTYMRGIPFLQIPTTFLAMIDSSIGGKTGVDTQNGKNLIGAFYQPKKVFIDLNVLGTLPKEEMLNGIAELIKHAIILDEKFFAFISDYLDKIFSLDESVLVKAIKWSCTIKKSVVENDEKESSLRKLLNFGHTIGHAVEKASGYRLKHGSAVAIGIVAETNIARELRLINPYECKKIISLIEKAGFQAALGNIGVNEVIKNIRYDKKNLSGKTKYTLPKKVGKAEIDIGVSEDIVAKVLGEMK